MQKFPNSGGLGARKTAPAARPQAGGSWFGSQGLFRPGVRLFRRMRFGAKAWVISATFLAPLLLLSWFYFKANREAWVFAESELAGVHQMRQLDGRLRAVARGGSDPSLMADIENIAEHSRLMLEPAVTSHVVMEAAIEALPRMLELWAKVQADDAIAKVHWEDARQQVANTAKVLSEASGNLAARLDAGRVLADPPASTDEILALQGRALDLLEAQLLARMAQQRTDVALLASFIGLSLALAAYLFYSFALVLGGGIRFVTDRVNHVADGVLSGPSHAWGQDEFAYVASRVAEMQNSLVETMVKVAESANEVAIASEEMSRATTDLSDRTTQGTQRLRETSRSMTEMQSVAEQAAEQTRLAATEAQRNATVAQAGGKEITDAVATMAEVRSSATRIHDITSLIDSIAFQTNILALNAAVEAARAGEAGRGFAVVASEVRMLAGRSAEAAKEIKALIQASVNSSEAGVQKVSQAGQTMQMLVDSAGTLRDALEQIAGFAAEQANRMAGMSGTVGALDEMTERNGEMVERTSSAAQHMMSLSSALAAEAARFSLPEHVKATLEPKQTR